MIKYFKNKVLNYFRELNSIDLLEFNHFIVRRLILNLFKADNILPVVIGVAVLTISISVQRQVFIFIPQGSIASFASFILLVVAIATATIVFYPLIIICLVNYFGHRIRRILSHTFLWVKLLVITIAFYFCVTATSPAGKGTKYDIYMTCAWLLLYFILANLFLTYKHQKSMFKLTASKIFILAIFLIMVFPQFVLVFIRTSAMINYTTVNPKLYLSANSCQLLSRNTSNFESSNLTINNPEYFMKANDGGCFIYSNAIRYGFASDYTIIFRKNINAVVGRNGKLYNQYIRLSCYSGNCYAADNVNVLKNTDVYGDMIKSSREHSTPLDPRNL